MFKTLETLGILETLETLEILETLETLKILETDQNRQELCNTKGTYTITE